MQAREAAQGCETDENQCFGGTETICEQLDAEDRVGRQELLASCKTLGWMGRLVAGPIAAPASNKAGSETHPAALFP